MTRSFFLLIICFMTTHLGGKVNINPATEDLPHIPDAPFSYERPGRELDDLIEVTEKNLRDQQALRDELSEYQRIHRLYIQDTSNQDLSEQLVYRSEKVLKGIQEQHLTHAFEPEFLQELSFFAKIAEKWKTDPRSR